MSRQRSPGKTPKGADFFELVSDLRIHLDDANCGQSPPRKRARGQGRSSSESEKMADSAIDPGEGIPGSRRKAKPTNYRETASKLEPQPARSQLRARLRSSLPRFVAPANSSGRR